MTKALDTWQLGALLFQMATGESLVSALAGARARAHSPSAGPDGTSEPKEEPEKIELAPLLETLDQTAIDNVLKAKISTAGADAGIKRQIQELLRNILQVREVHFKSWTLNYRSDVGCARDLVLVEDQETCQ